MDLVAHHEHVVLGGEPREPRQLVSCEGRPVGVVRIAEQEGVGAALELLLDPPQVEPRARLAGILVEQQRNLDDLEVDLLQHLEEARVAGGRQHETPSRARAGDSERFDDAGRDVGRDAHVLVGYLPAPAIPGEVGEGRCERARPVEVADIARLHRAHDRAPHLGRDGEVHLGDEHGQHVRGMAGPLEAAALRPQPLRGEVGPGNPRGVDALAERRVVTVAFSAHATIVLPSPGDGSVRCHTA